MNDDQIILPVPEGVSRPLWSVMIPVYNRTKYVSQAVESVLAQDPGPDKMQICVVDNSTEPIDWTTILGPETLRRIDIFKQPKSVSGNDNWNTCIRKANGHLVHILHDDDWVADRFYEVFTKLFSAVQSVAIICCRCFVVDEDDAIRLVTDRKPLLESSTQSLAELFPGNPIRCPGVVIRRSFYEAHGGFSTERTWTIDYEMWARAFALGSGVLIKDTLAYYRGYGQRDHHDKLRDTSALLDQEECFKQLLGYDKNLNHAAINETIVKSARSLELKYNAESDYQAARKNRRFWRKRVGLKSLIKFLIQDTIRLFVRS